MTGANRYVLMAIFGLVNTAMAFALHYYAWTRLVRATSMSPTWTRRFSLVFAVLATSLPIGLLGTRVYPVLPRSVGLPVYIWMAVGTYLMLIVISADLVRAARRLWHRGFNRPPLPVDHERRLLLSRVVAGSAAVSSVGIGALAIDTAIAGPVIKKVRVGLRRFPAALDGLCMVQITDLHVGYLIDREYVEDVVRKTNAQKPDIVAITGDLVDGPPERLGHAVSALGDIDARYGVYFVTGNHEYYAGAEAWLEFLTKLGIRVLRNEAVKIGTDDEHFFLAGVDDSQGSRFVAGHGSDVAKALSECGDDCEVVLLAHRPREIFPAAKHGVGLMIAGHTHGGQSFPFNLVAKLIFPYVSGLAKHNETHVYVSRGTGYIGPPMRLGAPSEITRYELVHDEKARGEVLG